MEVISENNNKESTKKNNQELNIEDIPKLSTEEPSFQLITKEQEKKEKEKEEQSFNASEKSDLNNPKSKNEKSTEDNSIINISKVIKNSEGNERKNSINLNIEKIKEEKLNNRKSKKKKNMDNPPPEVYLGENIVRKVFIVNPMEVKLKRIEKEIESQYNYDYNKVMQEIKEKLEKDKKKEEQIKHIQEEDKKLKEKLKNMEEYRENKMKELIKRVEKKQKINRKNKNNVSNSNKNTLSSRNYIKTTIGDENNESNDKKKLPSISNSYDRYKKIMKKKENNEKDFILNTEEDLEIIGKEHEENYKNINNLINQKLQERKKLYDERNELYLKNRAQKELEKKERLLEKDIKHRYNVQLTILKSATEKNGKLQDRIQKNLENFNEKKIILMEKEKKKIKEYLKKINKYNNIRNKSPYEDKRKYYLIQQKQNINRTNKETEMKNNELLEKQGYLLGFSYNIEKDDKSRKKNMLKNNMKMQDENKKIYDDFNEFLGKIEKNNINNKTDKVKLKIYNKKVKEELEEKMRKEEEELKRLGL